MFKLASWALASGIIFASLTSSSLTVELLALRLLVYILLAWNVGLAFNKKALVWAVLFFGFGHTIFDCNELSADYSFQAIARTKVLKGRLVKIDPLENGGFIFIFELDRIGLFRPRISCFGWNKNLCIESDYRFSIHGCRSQSGWVSKRDGVVASGRIGWQRLVKFREPGISYKLLAQSKGRLSKEAHNLYSAVFLGYKENLDSLEIREPFLRAGLIHFMARSGLHVLMITDVVGRILKLFFVPWTVAWWLKLLFLFFYSIFSWPSVSFLRAVLMLVLCLLANRMARNLPFDHNFYMVLFATVFANPYQLFCLDFQLSFALTIALLLALN